MNKKLILSIFVLAGAPVLLSAAGEARLLRFPATNGKEIVFSYAGDLYKVPAAGGEAQRLTSHVGYEMFPRFSPDGKTIAFTGQYDGNTEVYTMPATGGEPLRVTYTATNSRDDLGDRMGPNNIVMTWTPDGQRIVYRNRISDGFSGKLFTVDKEGGLSEAIPLPEGGFCSYSPDGKQLAYNRVMREFRTWKYYKGGMADDIWVYNPNSKTVENITNNVAQDIFPMWIGDEIFFLSDRSDKNDRLKGFSLRGNDYLAKPFYPEELIARIKDRFEIGVHENVQEESFHFGNTTFNYTTNEIRTGNNKVLITSRQADLLRILATNLNLAVDRDLLLETVWGTSSYANSLALNVQVTYLRKALHNDPSTGIVSLPKKGYAKRIEFIR